MTYTNCPCVCLSQFSVRGHCTGMRGQPSRVRGQHAGVRGECAWVRGHRALVPHHQGGGGDEEQHWGRHGRERLQPVPRVGSEVLSKMKENYTSPKNCEPNILYSRSSRWLIGYIFHGLPWFKSCWNLLVGETFEQQSCAASAYIGDPDIDPKIFSKFF